MNVEGSDFGLFQTTIMLQDQVRLHTEALETALRRQEEHDENDASASAAATCRRCAAPRPSRSSCSSSSSSRRTSVS